MTDNVEVLAAAIECSEPFTLIDKACNEAAAELRRLAAVEYERNHLRARLDRAIAAAEEHFGEDAIRYKLSLNTRGRPTNTFPLSMDGKWFALQRADNDAHIGLSLRCVEAEAERDALVAERDTLQIGVELMQDNAARYCWLRDNEDGDYGICVWDSEGGWARDARSPSVVDAAIDAAMKDHP